MQPVRSAASRWGSRMALRAFLLTCALLMMPRNAKTCLRVPAAATQQQHANADLGVLRLVQLHRCAGLHGNRQRGSRRWRSGPRRRRCAARTTRICRRPRHVDEESRVPDLCRLAGAAGVRPCQPWLWFGDAAVPPHLPPTIVANRRALVLE